MSLPRNEAEGPEPVVAPDFAPELCGMCVRPAGCGIEKLSRPATCHSEIVKARGRLPVRRVEGAALGGMLIHAEVHMKRALNTRHASRHLHVHAVRRNGDHCQSVRLGEIDHGVIILLGGPEFRGELIHREELVIRRTAGVVEILEELIELILVAKRQRDHETQRLR
jgi:hypothetical protein